MVRSSWFALVVATLLTGAATAAPLLGPRTPLNTDAASDSTSEWTPSIATDGQGNWVAVWSAREVDAPFLDYVRTARSSDDGETWTTPEEFPTPENSRYPAVWTDGAGTWIAIWSSTDSLGGTIGTDADMFISRSSDAGVSWTTPVPLNDNAASDTGDDNDNFFVRPVLATDASGTWVAIWVSDEPLGGTIGTDVDLFFVRSTDGGLSWSSPAALNSNAATDTEDDWDVSLATDGDTWIAVWWSVGTPFDTDVWLSRSTDGGVNWSPAVRIEDDGPDVGWDFEPSIATDGDGTWLVAWTGLLPSSVLLDIQVARSTDAGATFSAPIPVRTDLGPSSVETRPKIVSDGSGHWIVAWQFDHETPNGQYDTDALFARSSDAGATWTPPIALNENPWDDQSMDSDPIVVRGRHGTWRGVWITDGEIEPGIGTDFDIAIVRLNARELPALSPASTILLTASLLLSSLNLRRGAGCAKTLGRDSA